MKTKMIIFSISTFLLFVCSFTVRSQYIHFPGVPRIAPFYGISPYISKAPGMKNGEYEVNIVPLCQMHHLARRIDYRANIYVNIFYKNLDQIRISSIGFDAGPVFYFKENYDKELGTPTCFYLTPTFRYLTYPDNKDGTLMNLFFLIEPGYHIAIGNRVSIMLGMEVGAKYVINWWKEKNQLGVHYNARAMAGVWLNI